ncbi:MAG: hypothetical protein BGO41_04595 [Clostridiales bacterium 38-18]|nr:MAG: hypothetical protein BGO41_04595 [Clostridiales bacterium 38-18]
MLGVVIDFESTSEPKYIQLYRYLKSEIENATIPPFEKLPSVRMLSQTLKVSKVTVENAYNQLQLEGYIESRAKSGYFVMQLGNHDLMIKRPYAYKTTSSGFVRETAKPYNSDGAEASTFNFTQWRKVVNRVLEYDTEQLLSYGDVKGELMLRTEIAKFVRHTRGVACEPEQIVIGAGIQYLFGLIATMFRRDHGIIAFEHPGFSKGMNVFEDYGYERAKIPLESDGIDIKALEASNAKVVYVSPSHQYPMGGVMGIKKRLQLLEWASKSKGYIIEDDYDSLLRYDGMPVPALQGLKDGEHVIYVGSFSKLLIPALRISFMVIPRSLNDEFKRVISRYSQSVSKIEQLALARYMAEGAFERHIRRIKKTYGKKNQLLLETFKAINSRWLSLVGKGSGLHVILRLDKSVNRDVFISACEAVGILLEPVVGDNDRIVVFSYSGILDDQMMEVVKTMCHTAEASAQCSK